MIKEILSINYDDFNKIKFDVGKILAITLGFFYSAGYLIQAISLRNYGIYRLETVKLQYIEVGVTYSILLLFVTAVPIGCYLAHFRIRKKSGLPNYRIGGIGYLLNTFNLFFVVLFFSLFITQQEWTSIILNAEKLKIRLKLYEACALYIPLATFVLVLMPLIERLIVRKIKKEKIKIYYLLIVEPIRYLAVIMGIVFDILIYKAFSWLPKLIVRGLAFLGTAYLLAGIIIIIIYYIRKLGDIRSSHIITIIGTTGVLMLLYICINAYVWAIIRHIPMNRGGKLPVTITYIVTDDPVLKEISINKKEIKNSINIGPVYVIEETQSYLHIAEINSIDWYTEWVPTFAIRKELIKYTINERIIKGGPRKSSYQLPSEKIPDIK